MALSNLVSLGRHTITGMILTSGKQFVDWSADYRLFSRDRVDMDKLFHACRREVVDATPRNRPFVAAMDDSIFRKRGMTAHGVAYRRDPLGPPFRVNFIRGQRFLQISAAFPRGHPPGPVRMIPIDFRHCPTPTKPKKLASKAEWKDYRRQQKEQNISRIGRDRLKALRQSLDQEDRGKKRQLVVSVDGGYTNGTVLKGLPPRTTLIGRIRKDAKLYYLPEKAAKGRRGRKRVYGEQAPTPEELRQDTTIPYQRVTAWATGKNHHFKIKSMEALKWRTAGQHHVMRLIVIAPLAYRLTKKSRLLYRKPAYLICTDPDLSIQEALQYYLWRWDIEVNFRDEKHILGAGQAQVRKKSSVENVPGLIIASYAMLLLAAEKTFTADQEPELILPNPKWRKGKGIPRASTQQIINHLRAELWGKSMGMDNFSGFVNNEKKNTKPEYCSPHLPSAVLYATV